MKFNKFIILIFFLGLMGSKCFAQDELKSFQHTVQAGQSLYSIANMYHVSMSDIVKLNPGSDITIYTGQVLHIPQPKPNSTFSFFYTIKAGETLYRLTQMYKVSAQDICDLNPGLNAENFHAGEVIRIPNKKGDATKSNGVITTVPNQIEEKPVRPAKFREMHKAKKKETVYSICKKYNISEEELINANPSIKNTGLQKGDLLYIPYPTQQTTEPIPTNKELFDKVQNAAKQIETIKLAVILPFTKDTRMVEYYEGLLLAVDSLKERGANMDIYAYDAPSNISTLLSSKPELKDMDIIIGPQDKSQIKTLGDFARSHKIRLVIPFTSKDDEVFANPYIYMVNTPQMYLYPAVYDHFFKQFKHPNVIFIESSENDTSKAKFIQGMKAALTHYGATYTTISDGTSIEEMGETLFTERENVFIPTSGTHVALIKILTKLELLVRAHRSSNISLFGYPEWQTITKEHLNQLFAINTYFYTSFFTNDILTEAKKFERNYRNTYHKMMENRYPKYGMLGYDTGFFFLKGLYDYKSQFENNANKLRVNPVQTGFLFKRVNNWGGFINQKVFFVHYTPQAEVAKTEFD